MVGYKNRLNMNFFYNKQHDIVLREYYLYIAKLIENNCKIYNYNIILGNYSYEFDNEYPVIKIDIQCEHTLVKKGGRGTEMAIDGKVPYNNDFYLVRIDKPNYILGLDFIIEYSLPNIENIRLSGSYDNYLKKVIYIAPLIYELVDITIENRTKIITMFINTNEFRRNQLMKTLLPINKYENINNCFSKEDLEKVYEKTRILVNIRQTEHHDTFEELRVLPALLKGVIIISEDVPLRDKIPYNEFIIWCKYDDVLETVKKVEDNYEFYWNYIFNNNKLKNIIDIMTINNHNNIKEKIK
jgi:hypothetical protein